MSNARNIFESVASIAKAASGIGKPVANLFSKGNHPIAKTAAIIAGAAAAAGAAFMTYKIDPHRRNTKFGTAHILNVPADGDWLRMMVVGNVCQSATFHGHRWCELPFEYYRAFDRMFKANPSIKTALMLGGGGFSYPKHFVTSRPDVCMDVIEPDGDIISLALEYFYLDRLLDEFPNRIRVFEDDGLEYLVGTTETYDAIINDAFCGDRPVANLATPEAIAVAKEHLAEDGVYLANVVAYPDRNDYADLANLVNSLQASFANAWVIPSTDEEYSDEENYLVLASDSDCDFPEAIPF